MVASSVQYWEYKWAELMVAGMVAQWVETMAVRRGSSMVGKRDIMKAATMVQTKVAMTAY
jgi:hypothetical protein